ncbi:MAG: hypothetical protein Q8Q95_00765 [bacterium]|nr:hypothetical protein [bacterium]
MATLMTGKQGKKLLEVFEDTPTEQVQAVLGSGLLAVLRDTNFTEIDRDKFRQACGLKPLVSLTVIKIDRTHPFNPAQFLGEGWSVWKGPADGDGLSGKEEQDERSLKLTELDLSNIQLITCLKEGESVIKGEEKLNRLKAKNHIRLDVKVFQTFWENKDIIPKSWKKKTNGNTTFIFFDGTILRNPHGLRGVLCLGWRGGKEWDWHYGWLEYDWDDYDPSAVLAS